LLDSTDRPLQFVFAGKAHPKDHGGKELIAQVMQMSRRPELRRRVVFLEDYDMNITRTMIHGVDVWLNNPRRPLEASGTSGMKICCNGGINLSILDGWWVEGYQGDNGWAIGAGEEYTDLNYQDEVEGRALYDLLEQEIVPTFYNRDASGLPRAWIRFMKRSIITNVPVFNTNRMVEEYVERCYWPSHTRYDKLSKDKLAGAKELAQWRQGLRERWGQIRIEQVEAPGLQDLLRVGNSVDVGVNVQLGGFSPDDVEVQLFYGVIDSFGEISHPTTIPLQAKNHSTQSCRFEGTIPCRSSGQYGFSVRVLPKHPNLPHLFEPALVTWG